MAEERHATAPPPSSLGGLFNPPDLGEDDAPRNKPISSARQALGIVKSWQKRNKARANKNKVLSDHYNGETPFDEKALEAEGESWRANFPTFTLTSIVDRVVPRTGNQVHQQKYLTPSKLPSTYDDAETKSEKFQTRLTALVRGWNGWNDYVDSLITENCLYGYTASIQLDANNWRPEPFRQEDLLFDENTSPDAGKLQCFAVLRSYYVHELVQILTDPDTAEKAGYHLEGLRLAIDKAVPRKADLINNPRAISDLVREANLFTSFQETVKTVETAHVFVRNYENGVVDQWWLNLSAQGTTKAPSPSGGEDEDDPVLLALLPEVSKRMEDVITLFTYQAGSNRYFGSKGLGRMLVNFSIMNDRLRMQFLDGVFKSQQLVGTAAETDIPTLSMHVRGSMLIAPEGFTPLQQQFLANAQDFKMAEDGMTQLAQSIAGAYLPFENDAATGSEPPTATEVQVDASREDEINQGIQNRWWSSFTKMMGTIQRRACSVRNVLAAVKRREARDKALQKGKHLVSDELYEMLAEVAKSETAKAFEKAPDLGLADEQAVEMIVGLLDDNLTPEEVLVVSQAPSLEFNSQVGAQEDARFIQFMPLIKDDAAFDQSKAKEMFSNAFIGPDRTRSIYIPSPEQTSIIEQQRQQVLEMTAIMAGEKVQVSGRDPHSVHFDTLMPKVGNALQQMHAQPPEDVSDGLMANVGGLIQHGKDHLDALGQSNPAEAQARQKPMDEALKAQQALSKQVAVARAQQVQEAQQAQLEQAQAALAAHVTNAVSSPVPPVGPKGALHIPAPPKAAAMGKAAATPPVMSPPSMAPQAPPAPSLAPSGATP